jgi:ParB-like chromosome segregation protein Spo0J
MRRNFWAMLDNETGRPTIASGRTPEQIHKISLSSISITNRLRTLRPEAIDLLAGSPRERGLIYPITVRPLEEGKYSLNTGYHRYAAARKLGWERID